MGPRPDNVVVANRMTHIEMMLRDDSDTPAWKLTHDPSAIDATKGRSAIDALRQVRNMSRSSRRSVHVISRYLLTPSSDSSSFCGGRFMRSPGRTMPRRNSSVSSTTALTYLQCSMGR